jgi:hypothetical protein
MSDSDMGLNQLRRRAAKRRGPMRARAFELAPKLKLMARDPRTRKLFIKILTKFRAALMQKFKERPSDQDRQPRAKTDIAPSSMGPRPVRITRDVASQKSTSHKSSTLRAKNNVKQRTGQGPMLRRKRTKHAPQINTHPARRPLKPIAARLGKLRFFVAAWFAIGCSLAIETLLSPLRKLLSRRFRAERLLKLKSLFFLPRDRWRMRDGKNVQTVETDYARMMRRMAANDRQPVDPNDRRINRLVVTKKNANRPFLLGAKRSTCAQTAARNEPAAVDQGAADGRRDPRNAS